MKQSKVIKKLTKCMIPHRLCRVKMAYYPYSFYYFPLKVNEKFFLSAAEDDFQLDGFEIRRIKQVDFVEKPDSKFLAIDIAEGVVDEINVPKVNISGWKPIFRSLKNMNRNIIIEHEDKDPDKCDFYIGKIEEVKKHSVMLRCFDADGVWDEKPTKIYFRDITSVTFGSRYVDVFSKYVPKL